MFGGPPQSVIGSHGGNYFYSAMFTYYLASNSVSDRTEIVAKRSPIGDCDPGPLPFIFQERQ